MDHGAQLAMRVRELTDRYRTRCLWFLREDWYPVSTEEILRVLGWIERHEAGEAYRLAAALGRAWHATLAGAREILAALPPEQIGRCVLRPDGSLYRGDAGQLRSDLAAGAVLFHPGAIRGAFTRVHPGAGGG